MRGFIYIYGAEWRRCVAPPANLCLHTSADSPVFQDFKWRTMP
jgi:hypothetical protein